MQEKHLFEYAVIRVVPRVEREECMNVGVVVYCARQKFLKAAITINRERLKAFSADIDINELNGFLQAINKICDGHPQSGPIGKLDLASRFRWLTATRSTIVQPGKIHPGLCSDPLVTLTRLHQQLVL